MDVDCKSDHDGGDDDEMVVVAGVVVDADIFRLRNDEDDDDDDECGMLRGFALLLAIQLSMLLLSLGNFLDVPKNLWTE